MSWRSPVNGNSDERVYFQVHGLPQIFKLKIGSDSPLHHLFEHIPTAKYQPPLCIDGPEFVWREIVLDPFKTPDEYGMPSGDRNVQTIHVNFPLVSPRSALHAQQSRGDEGYEKDTPREARGGQALGSARLSIEGDRRSPLPSAREIATPTNTVRASPRNPPLPSVDKIIDDLTQALRGAEDEIEDLQQRLDATSQQVEELQPAKFNEIKNENARLTSELESERRENDSKQEAIQILRNKIVALEAAASRTQDSITSEPSQGGSVAGTHATDALVNSLRHHCHSLEGELANREDDIRQLNARIASMNAEIDVVRSTATDEARQHREAVERLQATYAAQRQKDESHLEGEDSLRVRIDRLERENAILQSDNTTLAQRVVAAEQTKTDLRGQRNQHEIETAAWNAQRNAFEKEIKALREKNADQTLTSQRHEKVLSERNSALQEKIAFFEDPRSVSQREEEYQQRELEMRSRLRDALAENDRLKTIHKDLKRQVSELETSLFECNNVLVRVQRENTDLKRAGYGSVPGTPQNGTPRFEGRLPASQRTMAAQPVGAILVGSPVPTAPLPAGSGIANSKAADNALLHVDPFSLIRGETRSTSSPNIADALLLSRLGNSANNSRPSSVPSTQQALSEFQDA